MAAMRSLVAAGFGYSLANIHPRTEFAPDGGKRLFVPLVGPVRTLSLGLLLADGAQSVRTVRVFLDHAKAEITPARLAATPEIATR